MIKCMKCRTRIVTHLWVENERVYCSPACKRGAKSQFEKVYKQLKR